MTGISKYRFILILFLLLVFLTPRGIKCFHHHDPDFSRLYSFDHTPVLADTQKHHCPICEFSLFSNDLPEGIHYNFTVAPVFYTRIVPDIHSLSLSVYDGVICLRAPPAMAG